MKRSTLFHLPVVFVLCILGAASAQEIDPEDSDRSLAPYFFVEGDRGDAERLPLKSVDAEIRINGVIAHVTILQKYENTGTAPINARYVFPASTRAAVHGMRMTIGEHRIVAEIKEREQARKTYDEAREQGKGAALLKQDRPNVFGMSVANIMPGDKVDVELAYTEFLTPTDQIYEFVFPTVAGPRYSGMSESEAAESDRWVKSPYFRENEPPSSELRIDASVSSGIPIREIECRTHETDIQWENESLAKISLSPSERFGGNRDFILRYRLAGREVSDGLMLYEGDGENFFLLMFQPPDRATVERMPPREYIFVVDVSGSMHGFPLNVSKKLLKNLIGGLRSEDRFNVVLFAGASELMSPVSVPGSRRNIDEATRIIDDQRGGGGTEFLAAVETALGIPYDENYSRSVLIVSDGYIAAEKNVFELISNNLNRANFFAFGIGSSVNRHLMEGIAKCGQGEPFVVTDPSMADGTADKFRQYVGAPVLTGISVDFGDFDAYDVEPSAYPDLFADRPVTVFGKYRGKAAGTIALSAKGGSGPFSRTIDTSKVEPSPENSALPYLWARSYIARLSDFNPGRANPENRAQITSLGLTYSLLTSYTSFVAVHDVVRNATGQAKNVDQPLPLPARVSDLAVGGAMSNVPEPEILELISSLFVVGILIVLAKLNRRGKSE
jgi:Ca-activated chloride channel homolog